MPDTHSTRRKYLLLLIVSVLLLPAVSCKHHGGKKRVVTTDFSYDDFTEKLQTVLSPVDTNSKKPNRSLTYNVHYTYMQNEYYPIWLSHGYKADAAALRAMAELEEIKWDGIDPERYQLTKIKDLKQKLGDKSTTLADAIAFDTLLTQSYLAASQDLLFGRILPKKVDSLWYHVNDSVWNAPALLTDMQIKYVPLDTFRSTLPTYNLLRMEYKHYAELAKDSSLIQSMAALKGVKTQDSDVKANASIIINKEAPWITTSENDSVSEWSQQLSAYQDYMGIRPTGKLDSSTMSYLCMPPDTLMPKIAANMERIRWMQRNFGDLYILVDVPSAQLFFRKNGENVMHMRVVVGKPIRQTPSLYALMTNVVLNPPWGVPPTILKKDVLPGLEKDGKAYLTKKGLKAYDKNGKVVNASTINSKNYRRYSYKQAPGDDNSLGYVKFNLPNPWDIYLHDTPHRGDFGKRDRAQSSGCVRLQQPKEMAVYILSQLEKKDFTMDKLDSIVDTHKTQWRVLSTKIPVHIAYLTAFEDTTGKHISFSRDVYHRDEKLISFLAAQK